MLSHALGTAEPQFTEQASIVPPVQPVADYLNKIHQFATQLMNEHEQAPVVASTFDG